MKVQLDFNTKEITLESNVNLKEFVSNIKTLLPDWKEWKLSTNNTVYWTNPIPWTWNNPFCTDYPNYGTVQCSGQATHTTCGAGEITIDMSNQPIPESVNVYCLDVN